jgi:hypothetical protein
MVQGYRFRPDTSSGQNIKKLYPPYLQGFCDQYNKCNFESSLFFYKSIPPHIKLPGIYGSVINTKTYTQKKIVRTKVVVIRWPSDQRQGYWNHPVVLLY